MQLFTPIVETNKFHPNYNKIWQSPGHVASRAELQLAYEGLPKPDGNFIKDFQTSGFDSRVWELYLYKLLESLGFVITQPGDRPDFLIADTDGFRCWVEATTANATQTSARPFVPVGVWEELDEVAIKLGSALKSKMDKTYWELPHVSGLPLVFAISDFHGADPIRSSSHSLGRYLYGLHSRLTSEPGEVVTREDIPIASHQAQKQIPSGFFDLPNAENVSAVLFSNAGTVAKFNRIGWIRQPVFNVRMLRVGWAYDRNPTAMLPAPFAHIVGEREETWGEEAVLFHNPNARHPVPLGFFGDLVEEFVVDRELLTVIPGYHPMGSLTINMTIEDAIESTDMTQTETQMHKLGAEWLQRLTEMKPYLEAEVLRQHQTWER